MTKLPILLLASLPLLAQGTLVNLRKPGICPNATAALPQVPIYTGGPLPTCYRLDPSLTLDTANGIIKAASSTGQRSLRETFSLTTGVTITTRTDGSIHVGWQTARTPVAGSPVWVRWSNVAADGTTTDWFLVDAASDGSKVLDIALPRAPLAGDLVSVVYFTVEP